MYNQQSGEYNAPQSIPKPTIVFDNEVKEILGKTYPEMINGLINLSIKKFGETREFKEYFVKKEFREEVKVKEEIEENKQEINNELQNESISQVNQTINQTIKESSAISAVSAW